MATRDDRLAGWPDAARPAEPAPRARGLEGAGGSDARLFQALFQQAPAAMWVLNDTLQSVAVNNAACDLLGRAGAEVIGRPFCDCLQPEARLALQRAWPGFLAQGRLVTEVDLSRADGAPRTVTLTITADVAPDRHLAVAADQTEQRRAQAHLERQRARLAALRAIDRASAARRELHATLDVILEQVTRQLPVDAAAILLRDTSRASLAYASARGFGSDILLRGPLGVAYANRAAHERRPLYLPDLARVDDVRATRLQAAEGFVSYLAAPLLSHGQVQGVLELFHRAPLALLPEDFEFLAALTDQAATAIDNATLFHDLQRSNVELASAYDRTLEGWSRALDLRDKETEGHTQRVTELTVRLAQALNVSAAELVHIRRGALLHDIGKVGIPDAILLKPGPLTDEEWVIMRRHPVYAYELLAPIAFLRPALAIPYCHHERWDGSGYPRGLRGAQIPWAARIFAVVDVWDALRSDRPYRAAWSEAEAEAHVRALAGLHFDPRVVAAFLTLVQRDA
jgi:PAS domain S-box-containing protein